MKFGEYLVKENVLNKRQLEKALRVQHYKKQKLGRVVRDLGFLNQKQLNASLADFLPWHSKANAKELKTMMNHSEVPRNITRWASEHGLKAVYQDGKSITFLSHLFMDEIIEDFEKTFDFRGNLLSTTQENFAFLRAGGDQRKNDQTDIKVSENLSDEQKLASNNPYVAMFRDCLHSAKDQNVSDIHIEPKEKSLLIRFRKNGELMTWKKLSWFHKKSFIGRVKWLSNLDLAQSSVAQDGRASFPSIDLNLRVNAIPSRHGEKIVIRLLDQTKGFDLKNAGFDSKTLSDLLTAARHQSGLLLISGPTGSGKTTTLYGLLNALDLEGSNVTTLEDPCEYELSGVTQTEVDDQLSFDKALKALMRQDPDVILLGEIRDEKTAKLAFKMANTGHLVISTLHANGAVESLERLKGLGIDRISVATSLRYAGAQRLMKLLCSQCALSIELEELANLPEALQAFEGKSKLRRRNARGCQNCQSGITGRMPIMEYADQVEITEFCVTGKLRNGLKHSLTKAVCDLAAEGKICVDEVTHAG